MMTHVYPLCTRFHQATEKLNQYAAMNLLRAGARCSSGPSNGLRSGLNFLEVSGVLCCARSGVLCRAVMDSDALSHFLGTSLR